MTTALGANIINCKTLYAEVFQYNVVYKLNETEKFERKQKGTKNSCVAKDCIKDWQKKF